MKLRVTSIQRGCVYDGPGVRTTVFLKGCTMRCPWCCNPETISMEEEFFINDSKCLLKNGSYSEICENCERNGGIKVIFECPFGVSEPVSKDYTSEELYKILSKDFELMQSSGGGVTFSGGEPLLHIDILENLLKELKEDGIHIAFETTLTTSDESIKKAAQYADLFIVDLKLQPDHPLYSNERYLHKLKSTISEFRNNNITTCHRMVFVDSMAQDYDLTLCILNYLGVDQVELLCCHNLADKKYNRLGRVNFNFAATHSLLEKFSKKLNTDNIKTIKLTI